MDKSSSTGSATKRPRALTRGSAETSKVKKKTKGSSGAAMSASEAASGDMSASQGASRESHEPSQAPSTATAALSSRERALEKQAAFDIKFKTAERTQDEVLGMSSSIISCHGMMLICVLDVVMKGWKKSPYYEHFEPRPGIEVEEGVLRYVFRCKRCVSGCHHYSFDLLTLVYSPL